MLAAFQRFIRSEALIHSGERTLLAVSGGVDSMVMAHLFLRSGIPFGIAHCNFGLRGKESDEDEEFVRWFARTNGIPVLCKRLFAAAESEKQKISVQMAARDLRYSWFREVMVSEGYHKIATAHHRDDQEETFFINLMRSTGIAGLHGILPNREDLIRPMLFTGRNEIEAYATKYQVPFREDVSNREPKYLRNRIRMEVLPVLRSLSPAFSEILAENITRIRDVESIYRAEIEHRRAELVRQSGEEVRISLTGLRALFPLEPYLFEFIKPYGFHFSVTREIILSFTSQEAKEFWSPTHQLFKERTHLIIRRRFSDLNTFAEPGQTIPETLRRIDTPIRLEFRHIARDHGQEPDRSPNHAWLDNDKLKYPLKLRKWRKGDAFHPLGFTGRKKLSDFFIDVKLSSIEKEQTWLLCSGDDIVWVVGHRIDHRYRITQNTRNILIIQGFI